MSFPDANTGFSIDVSGALRFTDNGGAQWTPIDTGDTPSVNAIHAVDRNIAMLFTDRGIFRSTSAADTSGGGTTFEAIDNSKVRRTAFADFDRTDGEALFAMSLSSIWVSGDRGATWRTVPGPVKKPRYRSIDFVTSRQGFALTTDGRLWTTRNGGRTWKELPGTGTNRGTDLAFGDARHGYLLLPSWGNNTLAGWVLATSDGGATWRPQLVGLDRPHAARARGTGRHVRAGAGVGPGSRRGHIPHGHGRRPGRSIGGHDQAVGQAAPQGGPRAADRPDHPVVSGARVAVFARSARSTRWTLLADGLTTAGRITVDTRVRATTQFVAQWFGDADRNGDGSPVTTVTVKR